MPRKLIQRLLPDLHWIRHDTSLNKLFGSILHRENLWHINRRSVSRAAAVGLFSAFIPVPIQMIIAALLAITFKANIPISIILVWISNPLTVLPIFYFCYKVGTWLLGTSNTNFYFEFSWQWLQYGLNETWQPFLLGCLLCGLSAATLGYLTVRWYWHYHVVSYWQRRTFK